MPQFQPEGPEDAKIVEVGESLGVEEVESGAPFMGRAGQVHDRVLAGAGVNRMELYIDNLFHFMPSKNKDKKESQFEEAFDSAQQELIERLNKVDANIIVPIGDWALRAITGKESITKWRGSILSTLPEFRTRKAVAVLHPSFIMRGNWHMLHVSIADMKRVKLEQHFPEMRLDTDNFLMHLKPTFEQAMDFLSDLKAHVEVSVDIETRNRQIACVGVAQENTAMCIPIHAYGYANNNFWSIEEEGAIWRHLGHALKREDLPKIFQNFMYDAYYFKFMGIEVGGLIWDTMLMHHCLYHEFRHRLEFLTSLYTTIQYYKDDGKEWDPKQPNEVLWKYNCLDALAPIIIRKRLEEELRELNLLDYYHEWYTTLLHPYLDISFGGILHDITFKLFCKKQIALQVEKTQAELDELVGKHLNVKSTKAMPEYFYGELGMKKHYKRGTEKVTLDKKVRAKLRRQYPNVKQLELVGKISKLRDRLSDFYNVEIDKDFRSRCSYNLAGTDTGRTSSSSSPLYTGFNHQNAEREDHSKGSYVRSTFIPAEGNVFVNADLEQAEARIVAWLAQEPNLMERFRKGIDVYRWMAGSFRGIDPNSIDKKDPWRQLFKQVAHASHYGMGAQTLQENIETEMNMFISKKEAEAFLSWYFKLCPNIRSVFHAEVQYRLRKDRKLVNLLGRQRFFLGLMDDTIFRKGYAYVPQGSVSDVIKIAIKKLYGKWVIKQEGHDSLLLECAKVEAPHCMLEVDEAMKHTFMIKGQELTIPREVIMLESWGGMTNADKEAYMAKAATVDNPVGQSQ